jgi:hypothetical protein
MDTVTLYLIIAATSLIAVSLLSVIGLKGFTAWIALKRAELDARSPISDGGAPSAGNRIEIADLKERLRKLEAIAAGVDL